MQTGETRISVCMAAYNGATFIGEQIASILPQLGEQDELVIVDDASSDNTSAVVESFHDHHIRLFQERRHGGAIASFGEALERSTGDIVFLADQDDIWPSDKVKKFIDVFRTYLDVTAVMSDVLIVDASGRICSGPKFGSHAFRSGVLRNLIRNRYQGSAMAFRRRILNHCLPFPSDIPMHDVWIGLVNQLVGKVAFIPEPLLFYRRHGSNCSSDTRAPLLQMLRWRWALMKNLALFYFKRGSIGGPVMNPGKSG